MPSSIVRLTAAAVLALLATACGGGTGTTPPPAGAAQPAPAPAPAAEPGAAEQLAAVIAGEHRSPENRARDRYRHPQETLEFFGLKPEMTVIEIWPGAGWYTEILAPYLRGHGRYIAAHWDPEATQEYTRRGLQAFRDRLAATPALYDHAEVVVLAPPQKTEMVPAESVDMVLTFRNIHNWMASGQAETMFAAMYRVLKPGGVLGVVEHRASTDQPQDPKAKSGYVREDYAIALAGKAGFVLEAQSPVNDNPLDTHDHPKGVWTLPPTLADGDKDREKYLAIGESDRFTLRFRKPGSVAGVGEGAAPATDESQPGEETVAPPP